MDTLAHNNLYTLFNLINEDDSFMVFFYDNKKELDILEKWYKLLNKDFYIKETNIKSIERVEIEKLICKPYHLTYMDSVNKHIEKLSTYYASLKEFNRIHKLYTQQDSNLLKQPETGNAWHTTPNETSKHINDIIYTRGTEKNSVYITKRQFFSPDKPSVIPDEQSTLQKQEKDVKKPILFKHRGREFRGVLLEQQEGNGGNIVAFNDLDYDDDNNCLMNNTFTNTNFDNTEEKKNCLVVFCNIDMRPLIITHYNDMEEKLARENRFGFQFVDVIDLNSDMLKLLENSFDDKLFNSCDEVREFIHLSLKINTDTIEKNKIYNYLDNFVIKNDKIEDKVKFDEFAFMIEKYLNIDKNNIKFRHRLAKYLIKYGFNKKRFNDGFYYYGIVFKNNFDDTDSSNNVIV